MKYYLYAYLQETLDKENFEYIKICHSVDKPIIDLISLTDFRSSNSYDYGFWNFYDSYESNQRDGDIRYYLSETTFEFLKTKIVNISSNSGYIIDLSPEDIMYLNLIR